MNQHVKKFIEDNIVLIDHANYYDLFNSWYENYSNSGSDFDSLNQLFHIFEEIGINLHKESEKDRNAIIFAKIYECVIDWVTNHPALEEITLPEVVQYHLKSKLGLSLITLRDMFKDVAKLVGTQHNIIHLPFKIKRGK